VLADRPLENTSEATPSHQPKAGSVDKSEIKKKTVPKVNKDKLEKQRELDAQVAFIMSDAPAAPPQESNTTNTGTAGPVATKKTQVRQTNEVNIPKKDNNDLPVKDADRKQTRIDRAVAVAKGHGLADAAGVKLNKEDIVMLTSGAKQHQDNELASEKKFRGMLKTLDELNVPLSLLDAPTSTGRYYKNGTVLSKEHQALLGAALVLQKGYRNICKSIALAAQAAQLLRLLASAPGSTKIEGGTASAAQAKKSNAAPSKETIAAPSIESNAASSKETTVTREAFPSADTTSPALEEEIQVKPNVTLVFVWTPITERMPIVKSFNFSTPPAVPTNGTTINEEKAIVSSGLGEQSPVVHQHLNFVPVESGKSIFDVLTKKPSPVIAKAPTVVEKCVATGTDSVSEEDISSAAMMNTNPTKVLEEEVPKTLNVGSELLDTVKAVANVSSDAHVAVAIKTTDNVFSAPVGPNLPPVKVAMVFGGPGAGMIRKVFAIPASISRGLSSPLYRAEVVEFLPAVHQPMMLSYTASHATGLANDPLDKVLQGMVEILASDTIITIERRISDSAFSRLSRMSSMPMSGLQAVALAASPTLAPTNLR
jgi:hypothetical protein